MTSTPSYLCRMPRRAAEWLVSLLAGTPPWSCRYLAHPRLPLYRAASRGVISPPLELRITGFTNDSWSNRICIGS